MSAVSDPYSEAWSTIAWDGRDKLLAASLHFDRFVRHSKRLGFDLPKDFRERIFINLNQLKFSETSIVTKNQPPYLVKVGITSQGEITLIPRLNQPWPNILSAITVAAPQWDHTIRGTKHGDWKPYLDARDMAVTNNADISLLVENDAVIDGDRCMPILLDLDGFAYHPRADEGALDSITLEQIKGDLENAGIPVRPARITIPLILRAKEMIVIGSGMGIQSLGFIDGRKIGIPRGKLYNIAMSCWSEKLSSAWQSFEDLS
jgi:branched-subunit amino acid aminotransferase/4-amino-4-deoxychorismate lyase|tara:strand:+ start:609 stop:1391 length:783 start_codon:yes stop_codon:yes gene_type:complete